MSDERGQETAWLHLALLALRDRVAALERLASDAALADAALAVRLAASERAGRGAEAADDVRWEEWRGW